MMQVPLYLALFAVGALCNLALGPRRDGALVGALAFPCGLAVWVVSMTVAVAVGVPLGTGFALAAIAGAGLLFAALAARRGLPDRAVLRDAAVCLVLFTAGAIALATFSTAKLSTDSHHILRLAHLLGNGAPLDQTVAAYVSDRGVFTVLSYATGDLIGVEFLYALAPTVGLSYAMLLAVGGYRMARAAGASPRAATAAVSLALAALLSAYLASYHLVYVHTNQGSALYLAAFVLLVWLAEACDEPAHLAPAFLCLTAFALHRIEAPVFAGLFVVMAIVPARLPRRALAAPFAAYTAVSCAWLARLAASVPVDSPFLSSSRALALAAATAACFAAWVLAGAAPLRRAAAYLPGLTAALVVTALAAAFVLRPAHMATSLDALAADLFGLELGAWGITWWAVAACAVLAFFLPPLAAGRSLFLAVPLAAAVTLLLAVPRAPYRVGMGDSANRMFLHYLPLAMLYLVVKLAPGLSRSQRDAA